MDDIEKITQWMSANHVTQSELARRVFLQPNTVNKILNRKIALTAGNRARIFQLMGETEPVAPRSYRIDLNDEQEALIRRAAELAHKHVDEFVTEILDLFFGEDAVLPEDIQAAEEDETSPPRA